MKLVKAHMSSSTQACWRFLNNDRVTLPALVEPLREALREADAPAALLVHDWCKLDFRRHESKKDQVQLTHETDVGYELTGALLVSAEDGSPLAPVEQHLLTADGLLSTRQAEPLTPVRHLEQVLPTTAGFSGTKDNVC